MFSLFMLKLCIFSRIRFCLLDIQYSVALSLPSFTFNKSHFTLLLLSGSKKASSAYLKLLIFIPPISTPPSSEYSNLCEEYIIWKLGSTWLTGKNIYTFCSYGAAVFLQGCLLFSLSLLQNRCSTYSFLPLGFSCWEPDTISLNSRDASKHWTFLLAGYR